MKKVLFLLCSLLVAVSVFAQNTPPSNVVATALSYDKVKITWDAPIGTVQPARLNLFDQADMVTHPGQGVGGYDISAFYGGQNNYGNNANAASKFFLADDFTLNAAASITDMVFYSYQTGSTKTSTITGCYVSIYAEQPLDSTAQPIWTSDTMSCMVSTDWAGIYRTSATAFTDTTRPIMRVVAAINTTLPEGTYWVAVAFTGSLESGPWCSPRAVLGQVSTGNAMQYNPSDGVWTPWQDGTSLEQMGMPFIVRGSFVSDNLSGFNVYRDGNQLNSTLIEGFSFVEDSLNEETMYCYTVEAVYTAGSNASSDLVCATTPFDNCRIVELPWSDSFDTYGTGTSAYPTCWTKYCSGTSTTSSYMYTTYYTSAPASMYIYSAAAYYTISSTPKIDPSIPINTLRAVFMLRKGSTNYNLVIGMMEDPTDPTTFVPYDTLSPSAASTWEEFTVNFSNYTGNAHYIALRSGTGAASTVYVDDFTLEYIPSCERPSNIAVSAYTNNSLTLSWQAGGTETTWDLQYKMAGDEEWTEVYGLTTNDYTITDLTSNTQYAIDVKVKALCGEGDESLWREASLTATTACDPVTEFPYQENFDTYGTGTTAYPSCWTKGHTQTTTTVNYPYINSTNTYSAPGCLYFYSSSTYSVWAVSPYFQNLSVLQADFKLRKTSANYKLIVGVIGNPDDITTFEPLDTLSPSATNQYEDFTVNFTSYSGNAHYIAFVSPQAINYMNLDNLVIGEIQTCFAPENIGVDSTSQNIAVISWESASDAASYSLQYKLADDSVWTEINDIADTTYTLTDLTAGTFYDVAVKTNCMTGVSSYWSENLTVQTQCEAVNTFPYTEGFESYGSGTAGSFYPTCWSRPVAYQTGTTTAPFCNSAQHNTGSASLRFAGGSWAATPQLDEDIHNLQISFWLREEHPTSSGKIQVGVMSNPADTSTFELVETIWPGADEDVWLFNEISFTNTVLSGSENYIAFRQVDHTSNTFWYWLDDVEIAYVATCIRPNNVSFTDITTNSAVAHWSDPNMASSYSVRYRLQGEEEWTESQAADTLFDMTDLVPSSLYEFQVKVLCPSGESYYSIAQTFRTVCGGIVSFPYRESFDTYGTGTTTYPSCWSKTHSQTSASVTSPYITTTNNSAPGSLYMYAASTYYVMAIMPALDSTLDITTLGLSFMLRKTTAAHQVVVGVMEDPTDPSTFVPYDTLTSSATSTWEEMFVNFENYQGTGRYIAFKSGSGSAANTVYIDDVVLDIIPTCFKPSDVMASNITTDQAVISWTPNGNEVDWTVAYKEDTATTWIEVIGVTDTFSILTDLTPNTTYTVKVKGNCISDESDYTYPVSFTTFCLPNTIIPYTENFDSYATGIASPFVDCWTRHTSSTSNYPYVSSTYSFSPSNGLYFYSTATTYCYAAVQALDESIDLSTLQVSFKARKSLAANALEVGVMEDPNDLETYTVVETISPAATSTWEDVTVYLNSYTGNGRYITFKTPDGAASTFYIDNVVIDYAPECILPTNLSVSGITSSSAIVSWGAASTETEWQIVYGETGFSLDTVEPISISSNPFLLENLAPNTTYDVYVRTLCNSGDVSAYNRTTFTTGCAPLAVPYTENFDTYGTGTAAYVDCWQKNSNTASYPYIYSTTAATGLTLPGALYFVTAAATYAIAVLPEFDAAINSLQMSFAFKAAMNNGYKLDIGVMTDPADTSTFELIQTIEPRTAVWNGFTVAFTAYTGEGNFIAIRSQNGSSNTAYIDNVVVDYAPGCVAPMNLDVVSLATTSAEVEWRAGRDETVWNVAYGPTNFNPNVEGTTLTGITDNPYTITGLEPGTKYDFYVRAVCDGEETSQWSIKNDFRTDCLMIDSLPYSESFDEYGTGTGAFPTCWYKNTTYSTTTKYPYINTTNNSAPGSLYFASTSTTYNYAVLPEFDPSIEIRDLRATFMLRKTSASYKLKVGVMTDPSDKTTFVPVATVSPTATSAWQEFEVEFFNYTGEGHFIAFASDTAASNYMYLDDVVIDYAPTCHEVTHVAAQDITTSGATISWEPVNEGLSWSVEYGPAGFTPGSAEGTTVSVTDTFAVLTGLASSSTYDVYVQQICNPTDESPWSDVYSFATSCLPMTLPYTENFDSYTGTTYNDNNGVIPTCWANISSNATYGAPHVTGSGSYHYPNSAPNALTFTCGSAGADAYAVLPEFTGALNSMELAFAYRMENVSNGTMTIGYVTDISNIASTFNVIATLTNTTSITLDTVSFATVPAGTTGRLAFHWNYSSSFYSCGIDDISVYSLVQPCEVPTALTANNVSHNAATITWAAGGDETAWNLQYKTASASDWSSSIAVNNTASYVLSNLTAETAYQVRVQAACDVDNVSDWTDAVNFTTTAVPADPCITPSGLAASNVTYNSANITWVAGGSETAWNLQYKKATDAAWSANIATTAANYALSGLAAETAYQVRVQANCGADGTSDWSTVAEFTTTAVPVEPCDNPTGLQANNVTAHAANISWTAGSDENTWNLQYKKANESSWSSSIAVNTTPAYALAGLDAETAYQIRIQADCGEGNVSEWVTAEFTTLVDGISSVELANSISIMPNPAESYIELSINSNVSVKEAAIYNAFGQMIQKVTLTDNHARIDVSGMAAGMYFVRIANDNSMATKKFIKK